jgi:hypothetical protein
LIKSNPKLAGYLAIIASEFGRSEFETSELELITGESIRTIQKRLDALYRADVLEYETGENGRKIWRLGQNAACVDLFNPDMSGDTAQNESSVDLNRQIDASDDLEKKKAPQVKGKTSHTLKKENSTPPSKNPPENSPSGTKKEPPKSANQSEDDAIGDYLPELLETFGFDHDFGTVSRLTMRIINSDLEESEYRDYLTDQLYTLSEEVENGDRSRKMAQKLIGSTKSVKWYKENKAPTDSGQKSDSKGGGSYGIEVGKNDYDGATSDNSDLFDEYTPEKIIELAFEMGEDPTDYREDVFDVADLDKVDPEISADEFDRMLEQYRESQTGIPPDIDQQIA